MQIDFWTENDVPKGFQDAAGKIYYYVLPSEPGGILGLTADKSKGASHGDLVRYFLRGKKFEKSERDECFFTAKTCIPQGFFNLYPIAEIIESKKNDDYITFNLSFGPKDTDANENPLPAATIQELEQNSLQRYLNILQSENVLGIEKTILVRAAGNSGTDLTGVFQNLSSGTEKEQKAFDRLVVVGAVNENGKLADYSSYSNNPKDIIYVPVREKTQTSLYGGRKLLEGTSFAAPQITYLINQILDKYPELAKEPAKLKSILFNRSVAKLKAVTDQTGTSHPLRYFIEDPYDPQTLENALKVAKRLVLGLSAEEPRAKEKGKKQEELPRPLPISPPEKLEEKQVPQETIPVLPPAEKKASETWTGNFTGTHTPNTDPNSPCHPGEFSANFGIRFTIRTSLAGKLRNKGEYFSSEPNGTFSGEEKVAVSPGPGNPSLSCRMSGGALSNTAVEVTIVGPRGTVLISAPIGNEFPLPERSQSFRRENGALADDYQPRFDYMTLVPTNVSDSLISGTWTLSSSFNGTFTLQKQ